MERGGEPYSPAAAASALQWWTDAGVDVIVDEAPRDWLRPKPAAPPAPPAEAAPDTETLPDRLDLFEAYLRESAALPFATPSAPRVGPSGDAASGLMILTDMPTLEDCRAGSLLSGEEGRLFDRMMAAIGRDRGSLYLAAVSSIRSPDGRLAGASAERCAGLARHHVALVKPRALLLFGDACAKAMLGKAILPLRGSWHEIGPAHGTVRTLATFSPAHLLNQASAKAAAWADLQMLVEGLKP